MTKTNKFRSSDFLFRPSTLSAAMQAAGIIQTPFLIREPKMTATTRQRNDTLSIRDSHTSIIRAAA